jgi:DNA repair photolyase
MPPGLEDGSVRVDCEHTFVRWSNLQLGEEEQATLPGHRDPAVVRHFDVPEALDTRFYEIRARSALNRVPEASRMPFRWTINPYRGCSHACVYCLGGQTLILLADGRERALHDLRPGDRVVGTAFSGSQRVYAEGVVRDVWKTVKPAYRLVFGDGSDLVASGDHRLLSQSGWRYVLPADARLTPRSIRAGDALLGPGRGAAPIGEDVGVAGGVREIEALGELELFDITTETGDFIANGFVSHNCFARPTHTYLGFNAGRDFEREIVVKVNTPELVRAGLAKRSWEGEHVALGTNTDPYQWAESKYELMPGVWEAMRDFRNPCSVLSKSPLMLRDIGLFKQLREVTDFGAMFSIPTLDAKAWRASEPRTPHPRKRMEAVAELNRQGIPCGILIAPLMPGINDGPGQVEEILELAAEAGATSVSGIALHLRGEVRQVFMDWLESYRPDLVPRYRELYRRSAYAPPEVRERLAKRARPPGVPRRAFLRGRGERRDPGGDDEPWGKPSRPPRVLETPTRQETLF